MAFARSLGSRARRHREVPWLLLAALLFFIGGMVFPLMEVKKFAMWRDNYSLLAGIVAMYEEREYFLATIILLFSAVFPGLKLILLAGIWFLPVRPARRDRALRWMHRFARWSMLDVFVVALLLVVTKTSWVVAITPRLGVYLFAVAIVASMVATIRIEQLQSRYERRGN